MGSFSRIRRLAGASAVAVAVAMACQGAATAAVPKKAVPKKKAPKPETVPLRLRFEPPVRDQLPE
jgi:hypothetical protein